MIQDRFLINEQHEKSSKGLGAALLPKLSSPGQEIQGQDMISCIARIVIDDLRFQKICPKENYGLHVLDSGRRWKCSKCLCMSGIVGFMHCPIVQEGSFFSMHVRGNSFYALSNCPGWKFLFYACPG